MIFLVFGLGCVPLGIEIGGVHALQLAIGMTLFVVGGVLSYRFRWIRGAGKRSDRKSSWWSVLASIAGFAVIAIFLEAVPDPWVIVITGPAGGVLVGAALKILIVGTRVLSEPL